jgi:hypothetical protein
VKLAEEINNWIINNHFDRNNFRDLLELEEYLADFSDLVIVFVESPGSIAELGAFATLEPLAPKTLAVINSSHDRSGTFIADGPVQRLRTTDDKLVQYFPWHLKNLNARATQEDLKELSRELSKILVEREQQIPKQRQLSSESHAHKMLLAADLLEIIGIANSEDIFGILKLWDDKITVERLRKYLSLLMHLDLIDIEPYSNQRFYVSQSSSPLILYDYGPDTEQRDRERIKQSIRSELDKRNDNRAKAFRAYARRLGKGARYV